MNMPATALFLAVVGLIIITVGCPAEETTSMAPRDEQHTSTHQSQAAAGVELIKKGRRLNVKEEDVSRIMEAMPALLNSCRDREKRRISGPLWDKLLKSGTCIHIRYAEGHAFQLRIRTELPVTELLIPLNPKAWRGKILARDGHVFYSPFITCDSNRLDALSTLF